MTNPIQIAIQPWEMFVLGICVLLCAVFGTRGQLIGVMGALSGCLLQSPVIVILGLLASWAFERDHPRRS